MKYPECEKLSNSNVAVLREFMEWLTAERSQPYEMAYMEEGESSAWLVPANVSSEDLIMEFFGIDKTKLEKERRHMLAQLQ